MSCPSPAPEGARRNAPLLIFWMPPAAIEQEEPYTAGYRAFRKYPADVHVHLTAGEPISSSIEGSSAWAAEDSAARWRPRVYGGGRVALASGESLRAEHAPAGWPGRAG